MKYANNLYSLTSVKRHRCIRQLPQVLRETLAGTPRNSRRCSAKRMQVRRYDSCASACNCIIIPDKVLTLSLFLYNFVVDNYLLNLISSLYNDE